jgi:hypothetical protein
VYNDSHYIDRNRIEGEEEREDILFDRLEVKMTVVKGVSI